MNEDEFEFVISRTFDAPRHLMWKVWTEAERLKEWFGPKGMPIFSCDLDFGVGGVFLYGMRQPNGVEFWGRWVFREITEPEKLVFVVSFSDDQGNIARHPWNAEWPLEILSTITFEENENSTTVTVRWIPINATDIERKTFEQGRDSMRQGWTGTLDKLDDYLKSE